MEEQWRTMCDYLVIGREVSTSFSPNDRGRRISWRKTIELQIVAYLDISYGWLDAHHIIAMIGCKAQT